MIVAENAQIVFFPVSVPNLTGNCKAIFIHIHQYHTQHSEVQEHVPQQLRIIPYVWQQTVKGQHKHIATITIVPILSLWYQYKTIYASIIKSVAFKFVLCAYTVFNFSFYCHCAANTLVPSGNIYYKNKNIERHEAGTIVSWPNLKQWVIVHKSDLMMIIRQSIYILSTITTECVNWNHTAPHIV